MILLACLGAMALANSVAQAENLSPEAAVKATYLYKFLPFVDWPPAVLASVQAPLSICVGGDPGLAAALAPVVAGQHDGPHPLAVRDSLKGSGECHVLYIPEGDGRVAAQLLEAVKGKPVLTVTDLPQDSSVRGIINFVVDKGHVRFDIDAAEAAARGLAISSKLLSLARNVKTRSGP